MHSLVRTAYLILDMAQYNCYKKVGVKMPLNWVCNHPEACSPCGWLLNIFISQEIEVNYGSPHVNNIYKRHGSDRYGASTGQMECFVLENKQQD